MSLTFGTTCLKLRRNLIFRRKSHKGLIFSKGSKVGHLLLRVRGNVDVEYLRIFSGGLGYGETGSSESPDCPGQTARHDSLFRSREGNYDRSLDPHDQRLFHLLGEISSEEDASGRGMLSVIVVHKFGDMQPGPGFFELAKKLGRDTSDILKCWVDELKKVHAVWSQK